MPSRGFGNSGNVSSTPGTEQRLLQRE